MIFSPHDVFSQQIDRYKLDSDFKLRSWIKENWGYLSEEQQLAGQILFKENVDGPTTN